MDSYGKIIDSANRAIVDLTSRTGTLSLGAGAQVDLRAGVGAQNNDGVARGTLDLNARRLAAPSAARSPARATAPATWPCRSRALR